MRKPIVYDWLVSNPGGYDLKKNFHTDSVRLITHISCTSINGIQANRKQIYATKVFWNNRMLLFVHLKDEHPSIHKKHTWNSKDTFMKLKRRVDCVISLNNHWMFNRFFWYINVQIPTSLLIEKEEVEWIKQQ